MSNLIEYLRSSQITNRDIKIALARKSFWHFCKIRSPDFYKDDRPHLKTLCQTLQDFYEDKLLDDNGIQHSKLVIEMPPRHGKSRTLTNFSAWCLGLNSDNKIITASFNDDLAQDFSRFTRDIISEERAKPDDIIFSDIFNIRIKYGDASYKKWAIEGKFFSYKGTGIGGSVTGRGGNIIITDDPVKDAETAYNDTALDKIWLWYTGTFLSRTEEGSKQIICMTPWIRGDLVSRLMDKNDRFFLLSMPAFNGESMLCPEILSHKSYLEKKELSDTVIFSANYDMVRIDVQGRLYSDFKTYAELPENTDGNIGYTDTADEGSDYLCSIHGRKSGNFIYVTNVLYSQEAQEKTEPMLVNLIEIDETKKLMVESNNGGRAFARNIKTKLKEKGIMCAVYWFHQSKNKKARILTNAPIAQEYILFPEDWDKRWPQFHKDLTNYQRMAKNKFDDAPDALTGLIEKNIKSSPAANPVTVEIGGI